MIEIAMELCSVLSNLQLKRTKYRLCREKQVKTYSVISSLFYDCARTGNSQIHEYDCLKAILTASKPEIALSFTSDVKKKGQKEKKTKPFALKLFY